jgi:hypothetical protein
LIRADLSDVGKPDLIGLVPAEMAPDFVGDLRATSGRGGTRAALDLAAAGSDPVAAHQSGDPASAQPPATLADRSRLPGLSRLPRLDQQVLMYSRRAVVAEGGMNLFDLSQQLQVLGSPAGGRTLLPGEPAVVPRP